MQSTLSWKVGASPFICHDWTTRPAMCSSLVGATVGGANADSVAPRLNESTRTASRGAFLTPQLAGALCGHIRGATLVGGAEPGCGTNAPNASSSTLMAPPNSVPAVVRVSNLYATPMRAGQQKSVCCERCSACPLLDRRFMLDRLLAETLICRTHAERCRLTLASLGF